LCSYELVRHVKCLLPIYEFLLFTSLTTQPSDRCWFPRTRRNSQESNSDSLSRQAAIRISHSLPDLQTEPLKQEYVQEHKDPAKKVFLLPDRKKKFQTKVHRKNLNPVFNETFLFSRHDLIGHVVLKGLLESADLEQEIEYTMNILAPPQEKKDLGELMLSLCYLPTAGRLTVTVIKGRNLKAMDINGSSDPYVKICLICQGKRIKKKKTTVKKNTLSPVYNEALVFDLPAV
ncbi:putative synaptotagmin X, partial [Operophtera brumata]